MGQEIERKFLLQGDGFKFGMIQLVLIIALLVPWTHYVMPLMGFKSQLW